MSTRRAGRQAAVMVNPFSQKTTDPKIPDGNCTHSIGQRLQSASQVTQYDDYMDILIYPGLQAGVTVLGCTDAAGTATARKDFYYQSHVKLNRTSATTNPVDYTQALNRVSRWRMVSQGVQLSLTNNADDNDGWFEAIRFVPPEDETSLTSWEDPEPIGVPGSIITPNQRIIVPDNTLFGVRPKTSLVNHPSYCTGKVRDLHRYIWRLNHFDNSHDFNRIDLTYKLYEGGASPDSPSGFTNNLIEENAANDEISGNFIDRRRDAIFIRIHGRGANSITPSNTCSQPTKVLVHLIANQEIIYSEGETLSRYQTRAERSMTAVNRADRLAARLLTPHAPVETVVLDENRASRATSVKRSLFGKLPKRTTKAKYKRSKR